MPRKPLIRSLDFPYHIYNRSNNKEWFCLPIDVTWHIFLKKLKKTQEMYGLQVHQFVLLNNHYHLSASTPNLNISDCMCYFQREVTKEINKYTGQINHVFGGRYKWSLVTAERYFFHLYRYIYQNPVRSKLCEMVQQYKYTTVHQKLGCNLAIHTIPHFFEHETIPEKREDYLIYLNEVVPNEHSEVIKRGLKNKTFKIPKTKSGRLYRELL